MGNVMAYSGLVTKVRAMQAKLLTDQDFENIAALHSVPEAVEYLKGKPAYADALNRMDDTLYHRGNVEKCWHSHCTQIIQDCIDLRA